MKYILLFALLLPSLLWAQKSMEKKNSIQIVNGIGMGHYILGTSDRTDPFCFEKIESSTPGFNYRFGIDYQRQIIGGLSMKIGSRFSSWSNNFNTITDCYIMCCFGECNYQRTQKIEHHYIELPFALQYKFGENKLQFYVEIGANPMLHMMRHESLIDENSLSIAIQAGVGLSYQITDQWSVFGQLSSRIHTNEQEILPNNYGYLYEIGLDLGLGFSF